METLALFEKYVIPNYTRYPITLEHGEGAWIWDDQGNKYLDFFPGWGCNLLGHCPAPVVAAVREQVGRLIHVPNSWYTREQGVWAQMLSERSFGGKAFFCNSGTEANEAAIKLIRLHSGKNRYKIISFINSFHGRTMGSISATGQAKYHAGIGPLLAGFMYAPYGDLDAVKNLIDSETAAIMLEPIQGEGGVVVPPAGFLAGLRQLCDEHNLLLHFDEVQTGCGRTGEWFAYQLDHVIPDIMTLAKCISGGIAGAAMLCKSEIAGSLRPGSHAATFGGNPVAAAAGIASIKMIEEQNLLDNAKKIGNMFQEIFTDLKNNCELIEDVRIRGTMIGLELKIEGAGIVSECLNRGLLINCTHGTIIRLLPPMTLTESEIQHGADILCDVIKKI